jgi:hypothetical protein
MHVMHVTWSLGWADNLTALPPKEEDTKMKANIIANEQSADGHAYAPIIGTLGAFAAMMTIAMVNAVHVAMAMMG